VRSGWSDHEDASFLLGRSNHVSSESIKGDIHLSDRYMTVPRAELGSQLRARYWDMASLRGVGSRPPLCISTHHAENAIIQRSTNGVAWTMLDDPAATQTTYADSGLSSGRYYYRVYLTNGLIDSAPSFVEYIDVP